MLVLAVSCNTKCKEQSAMEEHNDSTSLALDNQSLRQKLEDSTIINILLPGLSEGKLSAPPVLPDSILNNHEKLYRFYRFTYLPSFSPNGFQGYDSVSYYSKEHNSKVWMCYYQRDPQSLSRKLFEYTPHYFIKKIFSGKIINKHKQDFIDKKELIKYWDSDRQGSVDEYWDDLAEHILYKLPEDYDNRGVPLSPYFFICKVLFSEKYTLFVFDISDGSGLPYGFNIMCTYNHDGECIDGIETGQGMSFGLIAPTYSYSYFDYKGFYHIIKVEINEARFLNSDSDEEWTEEEYRTKGWNKVTTYNEITVHCKYKLTDEGQFVLIKKDRKKS